ncbi:Hypothetical predicted protein [Mytilus galloprovincialis]|uniref:Endonuclease/exonuclease/phosphatase domain-containing protein n=1 Tax=Mytilus galloprovincialis TaxID=29158 RepID=A0A8B6FBG2_MYTGA|nr:Hypothetical predicted protein [Mytilus galloprovincialis]
MGYKIADFSVRNTKSHGGTAIYVRENLPYLKKNIDSNLEISCIKFNFDNNDITLVNLYDTASDTKLPQYNNIFDQIEGKFLLCGDFNAHHTMWGGKHTDTKGRELFSFLEYKDIVLLNDGTGTRCNPSTLELAPIDLSFCNSSLASKITWSVDLTSSYGSDHHVVNINFSHKQILTDDSESVYNYKKADWEAFSSKCNEHLSPDMISDNIEETCSRLTNKILQIAGECIPVKLKNNKPKKPQVPWWTPECTKSVKERNICKNRAQHTGFGTDFTIYREKERACRKTIKAAQAMYWESYCNSLNNDSKLSDVWKKVKSMLGKTFKKLNLPTLLYNNTKYECTQDKADILATNYAQVSSDDNYSDNFKSQKQDIEQKEYSKLLHYYKDNSDSYNEPYTMQELKDAISDTSDTSPGKDKITYSMFKQFTDKSLSVLLLFINRVWFLQKLPSEWKHSIISPVLKPGKKPTDPQSYRPIALTSNFVKIMEKMVNNRLRWYLEKNNFYTPNQSGFRKK